MTADELRAEGVVAHRWWTVAGLAGTTEEIRPLDLHLVMARILEHGAPVEPLLLGD